ncbi:MAG TPA: class I SAM-dependent methyltransferase [Candidatus Binataceae bacterium]|nr:class I SAM-dependent methyltransferase [Candidatus Binataceae bacterium]
MALDPAKFQELVQKMVGDMGVAFGAALILVGDRLGLYKALAQNGPATSEELATRTGTFERYVREWLAAQAAAGYVSYDAAAKRYFMTDEQAMAFANEESPLFVPGAFEVAASMVRDEPKISEAFRTGSGLGWGEHDACLFRGTERFFRPGYAANLTSSWLPALDGVVAKLERGATVADIGCGHGTSTILMAKAYPKSQFVGFDFHQPSIDHARQSARDAGVANRIRFEKSTAKEFPGTYDLIACFDCLHDMGDPAGASAHVLSALKPDGTWMIVEPFANDDTTANLNPIGRMFYSASAMICTPASRAQEVGLALGAQAGPRRLTEVIKAGGFSRVRVATQTPFNLILEARP